MYKYSEARYNFFSKISSRDPFGFWSNGYNGLCAIFLRGRVYPAFL